MWDELKISIGYERRSRDRNVADEGERQESADNEIAGAYPAWVLNRETLATTALTVPAFAVMGCLSRFTFQTTETRWQIAAFAAVAVGVERFGRLDNRYRMSILRGTLNAAAAAIVIVTVKFHLEPAARKHDAAFVRHFAKSAIYKVESGS